MAVDDNGPKISVGVNFEDFKKGLEEMDAQYADFITGLKKKQDTFNPNNFKYADFINEYKKRLDSFHQDMQKSFDTFFGQQGGNSNQPQGQGGFTKSEIESKQKAEQDLKKAGLANEEKAIRQRNEQIRYQKETLNSFKDFGLAIAGLASGGMGVRALLDFSHNMGRLETFLSSINAKQTNAFAIRNEMRKSGMEDGEIWGGMQSVSRDLTEMQFGNVGNLAKNTQHALKVLSYYNRNLQIGYQNKSLTADQQFTEIAKAAQAYAKSNPQLDNAQIVTVVSELVGGNKLLAQAMLRGNFNFSKEDIAKAKAEVDTLKKQQEIDREYQKVKLEFERALTQIMAHNAPEIIAVLKGLSSFLDKHGEAAIMFGLLFGFATTLGMIIRPLRMVTGLLRTIGKTGNIAGKGAKVLSKAKKVKRVKKLARSELAKKAKAGAEITRKDIVGALKNAKAKVAKESSQGFVRRYAGKTWNGTKWLAGKSWDAAKWVGSRGIEASEWVDRNPIKVAKGGGLLAGALPMVAYDLSIGNITDAKPTTEWDQPVKDSKGNLTRTGRKNEIEQAVDGKIKKSFWTGDYYVQTKDGTFVYLDRNFETPIDQILRRLRDKQLEDLGSNPYATKAPTDQKPERQGGFMEAILPSARAGDLASDIARRNGSYSRTPTNNNVNPEKVKSAMDILTRNDQYGAFTSEQAKGIIANLMGESFKSLDHQAIGDGGRAYGLAQWHADRQADFKRLFHHDIRQATFEEEMVFLKWEMANTRKKAGDLIRKAQTSSQATALAVKYYEQPKDIEGEAFRRQGNIRHVERGLNAGYRPNISLPQLQHKNMINNHTNNTSNASTTYSHENNGTYTINLNGSNATPEQMVKELKKRDTFPNAIQMRSVRRMQ